MIKPIVVILCFLVVAALSPHKPQPSRSPLPSPLATPTATATIVPQHHHEGHNRRNILPSTPAPTPNAPIVAATQQAGPGQRTR